MIKWMRVNDSTNALNTPTRCIICEWADHDSNSTFVPGCRAVERDGEWVWERIENDGARQQRIMDAALRMLPSIYAESAQGAADVRGYPGWREQLCAEAVRMAEAFERVLAQGGE